MLLVIRKRYGVDSEGDGATDDDADLGLFDYKVGRVQSTKVQEDSESTTYLGLKYKRHSVDGARIGSCGQVPPPKEFNCHKKANCESNNVIESGNMIDYMIREYGGGLYAAIRQNLSHSQNGHTTHATSQAIQKSFSKRTFSPNFHSTEPSQFSHFPISVLQIDLNSPSQRFQRSKNIFMWPQALHIISLSYLFSHMNHHIF